MAIILYLLLLTEAELPQNDKRPAMKNDLNSEAIMRCADQAPKDDVWSTETAVSKQDHGKVNASQGPGLKADQDDAGDGSWDIVSEQLQNL